MVDLSVRFAGLNFKNPVSIASMAPGVPKRSLFGEKGFFEVYFSKLWRKYYEGDVGSLTTGTIFFSEMPDARGANRFQLVTARGFARREGMVSAATMPDVLWPRSAGLTAIEKARREFTDMRILASIMGEGTDVASWRQLAREAEQAGAEAIELNLGSVMMMESASDALKAIMARRRIPSGAIIGLIPEVVAEIVKGIKQAVGVPVIVKVTPELGFYGLLGAIPLYREAGVDGLTCDHSIMAMAAPDIYHQGKPTQPLFTKTTWWSSAGLWNRMVSYRDISLVGKYAPDIGVEACGGFVLPQHVVEVLMLGASLVQLSSGIIHNGPSFPGKVVSYLKNYMTQQGYRSTEDFIGLGLKYIGEMGEVQREFKAQIGRIVAHVDEDKCVGPAACSSCTDMFCLATNERDGRVSVDNEWCCGCNLCVIKCPHGARSLVEIQHKYPSDFE